MNYLSLFLLLLSLPIMGQKCKFKQHTTDAFTGVQIVETKRITLDTEKGNTISYSFSKIDDQVYLNINLKTGNRITISPNHRLILKSESAEIFDLDFDRYTVADGHSESYWVTNQRIALEEHEVDRLLSSNIVLLRWESDKGYTDQMIKSKRYNELKTALSCLTGIDSTLIK